MQNFTKIINPTYFTTEDSKQTYQNFIEIEFIGGSLSFRGIMGPFKNGNCKGSCGQQVKNTVLSGISIQYQKTY